MKKLITKKGSCPIKDTSLIYRILKISLFLILFLPLSLAARDDNSMGKKLKEKSKSNLTYVEQILKVTGRLTDANGNPLPGVTILEKKTTNGTLSDQNGNFSISVSS